MDGWETKRHNPNYDWYVFKKKDIKNGEKKGV